MKTQPVSSCPQTICAEDVVLAIASLGFLEVSRSKVSGMELTYDCSVWTIPQIAAFLLAVAAAVGLARDGTASAGWDNLTAICTSEKFLWHR